MKLMNKIVFILLCVQFCQSNSTEKEYIISQDSSLGENVK